MMEREGDPKSDRPAGEDGEETKEKAGNIDESPYSMLGSRIVGEETVHRSRRSVNLPTAAHSGIARSSSPSSPFNNFPRTQSLVTIDETLPHVTDDDANVRTHSGVVPDHQDLESLLSPFGRAESMSEAGHGDLRMLGASRSTGINRRLSDSSSFKGSPSFAPRRRKSQLSKTGSIRKTPSVKTGFRTHSLSAALSPTSASEVTNFLVGKAIIRGDEGSHSGEPPAYLKKLTSMSLDAAREAEDNIPKRALTGIRRRVTPVHAEDASSYSEINKQLAFHKSRVIKKTPSSYGKLHPYTTFNLLTAPILRRETQAFKTGAGEAGRKTSFKLYAHGGRE